MAECCDKAVLRSKIERCLRRDLVTPYLLEHDEPGAEYWPTVPTREELDKVLEQVMAILWPIKQRQLEASDRDNKRREQ